MLGQLSQNLPVAEIFAVPAEGSSIPGYLTRTLAVIEEATFTAAEEKRTFSADREYIRMASRSTVRIGNLITSYGLELQVATCLRLIDRVLRKLIVPFSGEPLKGIQVMGVLETRALEFKNVLFLSLNEGIFPRQSYDNTYIPYNIRRAFGLPTVNEHESIYAYYFFRLLRKPVRGWFLYNSTAQGPHVGRDEPLPRAHELQPRFQDGTEKRAYKCGPQSPDAGKTRKEGRA